jgi:hypothetical protein
LGAGERGEDGDGEGSESSLHGAGCLGVREEGRVGREQVVVDLLRRQRVARDVPVGALLDELREDVAT